MDDAVDEGLDYIAISFELCLWRFADGHIYLEEDYPIAGEIWRVHKSDPDPYPSDPHAHCIEGKHKGKKLHLGTAQLFTHDNKPTRHFLQQHQFDRLIDAVQRKFPDVRFPHAG